MLTAAKEGIDRLAVWGKLGMYAFMAYALAQHVSWIDAVASVFALATIARAMRSTRANGGEEKP